MRVVYQKPNVTKKTTLKGNTQMNFKKLKNCKKKKKDKYPIFYRAVFSNLSSYTYVILWFSFHSKCNNLSVKTR